MLIAEEEEQQQQQQHNNNNNNPREGNKHFNETGILRLPNALG